MSRRLCADGESGLACGPIMVGSMVTFVGSVKGIGFLTAWNRLLVI